MMAATLGASVINSKRERAPWGSAVNRDLNAKHERRNRQEAAKHACFVVGAVH